MTVTDGATVNVAYLVSMPELTVDPFVLDSVPLLQASGIVAEANQAFVAQRHPEGRITFIDLDTGELHTLTGFELRHRCWAIEAPRDCWALRRQLRHLGLLCLRCGSGAAAVPPASGRHPATSGPADPGTSGSDGMPAQLGTSPARSVSRQRRELLGGWHDQRGQWRRADHRTARKGARGVVFGAGRVGQIRIQRQSEERARRGDQRRNLRRQAVQRRLRAQVPGGDPRRFRRDRDQRAIARHDALPSIGRRRHHDRPQFAGARRRQRLGDQPRRPLRHCVDAHREGDQKLDPTAGSQTITVLDLEQATNRSLSVGFHPTQVVVDDKSARAFVVSDDGVSVVKLGDSSEVSLLAHVSEDPTEKAAGRDVSILPDGSFAVVRLDNDTNLRLVDLSKEDAITAYDLGAAIADVDLSKDGKLAVAAVPGYHQVVLVPMPPTGDAASFERVSIPGEITSSVALSDDSSLALLYQNGADNSHLTVLDLRDGMKRALRTVDVKGPVSAAFAAPGAASAIVFQKPITGSKKAGLFSAVPTLEPRPAKIVGTDAVPSALAFDEAGSFALVTVGDDKSTVHGVYRVRLDTMQEDFLELASPPSTAATGIVEGVGRGFVAQSHPEGRITFIDLETAHADTITGFELAARIVQ